MTVPAFSRGLFTVAVVFLVLNYFQYQSEALVLKEEFWGKIVTEMKVNLPVDEVWDVYRSKEFEKLLPKLSPTSVKQLDFLKGDGGVGTLVNLTAQLAGGGYWLYQITEIDDETMTRVVRYVQGVYQDAGFPLVQSYSRVIKKEKTSCIIKNTLSFTIKQESLSNNSLMRASFLPAAYIVDYINSKKSTPLVLHKEFKGVVVTEMKVNLPADALWDVYRSKDFARILLKLSPNFFRQIDYIKGDGGVGTIFNITRQPAFGGANWLDEIIVIDDKTKTRELAMTKGGVLAIGFTEFSSEYKIFKKAHKSCVIRASNFFKIGADYFLNASVLTPSWITGIDMSEYVYSMKV